jgi:hypothetical protein
VTAGRFAVGVASIELLHAECDGEFELHARSMDTALPKWLAVTPRAGAGAMAASAV